MKRLYISRKVERTLESLKQSGKQGNSLAQKAARIMAGIISSDIRLRVDASRMCTKFGEKRIRSCRKYDLGSGYRLITIKRGSNIYIPMIGPHDECQRWLEKNSSLKEVAAGEAAVFHIELKNEAARNRVGNDLSPPDNDDGDDFLRQLSDEELRSVFCGLVEGTKK